MTTYDWRPFLERLSRAVLESPYAESYDLPPDVVSSDWLGFPGATEEQITAAEMRLGTSFPPSYREFLKVTNGWRHPTSFIYKLWSVKDIEWFRTRNQDWIDGWTKGAAMFGEDPLVVSDGNYFVYGPEQDCINMRVEYLSTALEISEMGDMAFLLLNPQITTPEGEWEAWAFASWFPGADRYRSFWDLMQAYYERLREQVEQQKEEAKRLQPTDTPETIHTKLSDLIPEIEKMAELYPSEQRTDEIVRSAANAAQEVMTAVRHAASAIEDSAQLIDRLAAIAQEFEQKAVDLTSQINARIRQAEVIRKEAANDDAWREWGKQSQNAGRQPPLPPELLQNAIDSLKAKSEQLDPLLEPNRVARATANAYERCTKAIRSFLKNTTSS